MSLQNLIVFSKGIQPSVAPIFLIKSETFLNRHACQNLQVTLAKKKETQNTCVIKSNINHTSPFLREITQYYQKLHLPIKYVDEVYENDQLSVSPQLMYYWFYSNCLHFHIYCREEQKKKNTITSIKTFLLQMALISVELQNE